MPFLYLDDSKHPQIRFVLGAFVALEDDPTLAVEQALLAHGLLPYVDEFKSCDRMADSPHLQSVREALRRIVSSSRIGVAVAKSETRLPGCCTALLEKMLRHEGLGGDCRVFTDRGIYHRLREQEEVRSIPGASRCTFSFEVDSRRCLGIQLADLVASTCGLMMKDSLELLPKVIRSGENSGYDPDSPMELGFAMWASIRYNFLAVPEPGLDWRTADYAPLRTVYTEQFGLVLDDRLPDDVRAAAQDRFGSMYLGCIH